MNHFHHLIYVIPDSKMSSMITVHVHMSTVYHLPEWSNGPQSPGAVGGVLREHSHHSQKPCWRSCWAHHARPRQTESAWRLVMVSMQYLSLSLFFRFCMSEGTLKAEWDFAFLHILLYMHVCIHSAFPTVQAAAERAALSRNLFLPEFVLSWLSTRTVILFCST